MRCLGGRYRGYQAYGALRFGFDGDRLSSVLLFLLSGIAAVLIAVDASWHAILRGNEIVLSTPWTFQERVLRYDDVSAIESVSGFVAPVGKYVEHQFFRVELSDGSTWSMRFDFADATNSELQRFIDVLSERSHRGVRGVGPPPGSR